MTARDRAGDVPPRLTMTPMIDVVFLVLIFFLCTLKLRTLEGTLEGSLGAELPRDVGVGHVTHAPVEHLAVRIVVQNEGNRVRRLADGTVAAHTPEDDAAGRRYDFDDSRVLLYAVGPMRTTNLADAVDAVRSHVDAVPDRRVTIDARDGVVQGDVAPLLDGIVAAGARDVAFRAAPRD